MSLAGQTIWVVGGVGTVGRGISRGLLQAGATVIVNSRRKDRIERITEEMEHPQRLIAIHGSLKPEFAHDTVQQALRNRSLDHVVAHGAVRYWTPERVGYDETHSLKPDIRFLRQSAAEFAAASSALASFHFSAVQELLPRIVDGSYTFVTGDGCGHPNSKRSPMGELNAHHVRGLAAAMRTQLSQDPNVHIRELRLELNVPQKTTDQPLDPSSRPISEEIGDLVAGWISSGARPDEDTAEDKDLIKIADEQQLDALLSQFRSTNDESVGALPSICDFANSSSRRK